MVDLVTAAVEIQFFLQEQNWKFCFIGGLAVQYWGEPRMTRDIDLTLMTGFGAEEAYVDRILAKYSPRIDDARDFALHNRVILVRTASGVSVDISLAGLEFEENVISRSVFAEFLSEKKLRICSAEDLIVLKAFAGRPIDWQDIEGIVSRQTVNRLDWVYIEKALKPLLELKEAPEDFDQLIRLKAPSSE